MNNWQEFKDNQEVWDQITLSFRGNYRQLFLWGERQVNQGWKVDRYISKEEEKIVSSVQIFSKSFLFFKFESISTKILPYFFAKKMQFLR